MPDPGALREFPFWAKADESGEKKMSLVKIALRLAFLRARQRQLWPCPPVMSGDGKVVVFRDTTKLYIVDARKEWEASKADDGMGPKTVR